MATPRLGLRELADEQTIYRILLDHALRGIRIQAILRLLLAVFVVAVVALDPPAHHLVLTWTIAICYLVWCVALAVVAPRGGITAVRFVWLVLFIDLATLTAVALVASRSDQTSWTSDVLIVGFAIIPMIAATQLRPSVCVAIVVPTVIVFFLAAWAARSANGEPWSSVVLHTFVIAALGLGAVLLSSVQRSRVETIGSLAAQRSRLLDETREIEDRERRELAETLHDGALQYVLAARQELEQFRHDGEGAQLDRVAEALRESSALLRSTLTVLHPAILEQAGLPTALAELVRAQSTRPGLTISLDTAGWPPNLRTDVDALLFATARELLTNVVKHAAAQHVEMTIEYDGEEEGGGEQGGGTARLVVVDDGVGVDTQQMARSLAEGHIGLASRRVRIEASGGTLSVEPRRGGPRSTGQGDAARPVRGTVAIAQLPVVIDSSSSN